VLVDVPQGVEPVEFAPADLVLESPVQGDADLVDLVQVRERLDRAERFPRPGVVEAFLSFFAVKKRAKSCGVAQIGNADAFSWPGLRGPLWLRRATSNARFSRAARRLCTTSPTVVLITTGIGLVNLRR